MLILFVALRELAAAAEGFSLLLLVSLVGMLPSWEVGGALVDASSFFSVMVNLQKLKI